MRFARRLRRFWKAVIGGGIVLVVVVGAIAAPAIAPAEPTKQDLRSRLLPPSWHVDGDQEHLLGTDGLGRDVLSRLLFGARVALIVGLLAVALQASIGVSLGVVAGYYGGAWDMLLMRVADLQLAVPFLVLAMAFLGALGTSVLNIVLVLGIAGWVPYSRVARASTLAIREGEMVEAARAVGAKDLRIILTHILPLIAPALIVVGTQQIAAMILAEASLSFLGLGVPPPTPTWGGMVADGRTYLATAWYVSAIPGLVILVVILGINLLGDWLSDWLNPVIRLR